MIRIPSFAKGGKSNSEAKSELNDILQVLTAIGIDENTAISKLNEIGEAKDIDTLNNIQRGVYTIIKGDDSNAVKESIAYLSELFGVNQTQMQKHGGKLEYFVSKFKHGGNLRCGCGTKLNENGGNIKKDKLKCGNKVRKHQPGGYISTK